MRQGRDDETRRGVGLDEHGGEGALRRAQGGRLRPVPLVLGREAPRGGARRAAAARGGVAAAGPGS